MTGIEGRKRKNWYDMCVYVCIYVLYMCVCIHIDGYMCVYIDLCIYLSGCVCLSVSIYMYVHLFMYICICVYMCICAYKYVNFCISECIYLHFVCLSYICAYLVSGCMSVCLYVCIHV